MNKVQDGVTKAHAAYTWRVQGLSPADGVTAQAGTQSLGATGTIDIPIAGNQGTATIAVTAVTDGDEHDETAVFTLTGITFSGGDGADIDDLATLSDAVTIRILDDSGGDGSPIALDDRIKVPAGGTATTLVGRRDQRAGQRQRLGRRRPDQLDGGGVQQPELRGGRTGSP